MQILKGGKIIVEVPVKWQLDCCQNKHKSITILLKSSLFDFNYFVKYNYFFNYINNDVNIDIGFYKDFLKLKDFDIILSDKERFAAYNMCEILRI